MLYIIDNKSQQNQTRKVFLSNLTSWTEQGALPQAGRTWKCGNILDATFDSAANLGNFLSVVLAGLLRLLLGLQCSRGPGGPAGQDHGEAGGPQPSEPCRLFLQVWKPWLQWRLHAQGLWIRCGEWWHRLRSLLPLRRTGESTAFILFVSRPQMNSAVLTH